MAAEKNVLNQKKTFNDEVQELLPVNQSLAQASNTAFEWLCHSIAQELSGHSNHVQNALLDEHIQKLESIICARKILKQLNEVFERLDPLAPFIKGISIKENKQVQIEESENIRKSLNHLIDIYISNKNNRINERLRSGVKMEELSIQERGFAPEDKPDRSRLGVYWTQAQWHSGQLDKNVPSSTLPMLWMPPTPEHQDGGGSLFAGSLAQNERMHKSFKAISEQFSKLLVLEEQWVLMHKKRALLDLNDVPMDQWYDGSIREGQQRRSNFIGGICAPDFISTLECYGLHASIRLEKERNHPDKAKQRL